MRFTAAAQCPAPCWTPRNRNVEETKVSSSLSITCSVVDLAGGEQEVRAELQVNEMRGLSRTPEFRAPFPDCSVSS